MLNIFIGAGASFDFGMPLVKSFTHTFKENIIKRLDTNLFNFDNNISIKNQYQKIIEREDLHYEEMIKELELWMLAETGVHHQVVSGLVSQTIECVHLLLLEIQTNSFGLMSKKFNECNGINNILEKNGLLNIFSLNHDVMTEELCNYYKIQYKDGFRKNAAHKYNQVGEFKVATEKEFTENKLDFYSPDDVGINIFKLHGALDIFAIEDKEKYLKIDSANFGDNLWLMNKIEKHSRDFCTRSCMGRGINELFVEDDSGELQFLRRSLLSGGHKFTGRFEQIAPIGLFDEFKNRISDSRELIVIGYGFGDEHVNKIILDWIEKFEEAKIIICDPFRDNPPSFAAAFKEKIEIRKLGFIGFLNSYI